MNRDWNRHEWELMMWGKWFWNYKKEIMNAWDKVSNTWWKWNWKKAGKRGECKPLILVVCNAYGICMSIAVRSFFICYSIIIIVCVIWIAVPVDDGGFYILLPSTFRTTTITETRVIWKSKGQKWVTNHLLLLIFRLVSSLCSSHGKCSNSDNIHI